MLWSLRKVWPEALSLRGKTQSPETGQGKGAASFVQGNNQILKRNNEESSFAGPVQNSLHQPQSMLRQHA